MFELEPKNSIFSPVLNKWLGFAKKSTTLIWKPFKKVADWTDKLPHFDLFFCGFCFIFVPLILTYVAIYLAIMLVELAILVLTLIIMVFIFLLIGIWPALIVAFSVLIISIYRMPMNIWSHFLIIYRTVILAKSLKFLNFLLILPVHLLIPFGSFLLTLVSGLVCCIGYCIIGIIQMIFFIVTMNLEGFEIYKH